MRCYICNRSDDLIVIEQHTQQTGPCTVCQQAINECLEEYEDIEDQDELLTE